MEENGSFNRFLVQYVDICGYMALTNDREAPPQAGGLGRGFDSVLCEATA